MGQRHLANTAQRWSDPVIEAYKRDVDRTLLREALKLTPEQRLVRLQGLMGFVEELQRAGREARKRQ